MQYNIDNQINNDSNEYIEYDVDRKYLFSIKSEEQRLEAVYLLLDEDYVKRNEISLYNLKSFLYEIDDSTMLVPIKMKSKYGINVNTFILESYLTGDNFQKVYFIIRVNNENQSFSIEFIKDSEKIQIKENDNNIKQKKVQ